MGGYMTSMCISKVTLAGACHMYSDLMAISRWSRSRSCLPGSCASQSCVAQDMASLALSTRLASMLVRARFVQSLHLHPSHCYNHISCRAAPLPAFGVRVAGCIPLSLKVRVSASCNISPCRRRAWAKLMVPPESMCGIPVAMQRDCQGCSDSMPHDITRAIS